MRSGERQDALRHGIVLGAILGLAALACSPGRGASERHALYLVAHADDWQLFQAPNAAIDIAEGAHVVFVQLTASDAGRSDEYWRAREQAARASVRWIVGDGAREGEDTITACSSLGCHQLVVWKYGTVTSVYLRLPDGGGFAWPRCGISGNGTPARDCQSLTKLRDAGVALPAVDGSATYVSWPDLVETIGAVSETLGVPNDARTWLNAPDFDRALNPGDHADHYAVGDVAQALLAGRAWKAALFVDYDTETRPVNLSQADHDTKMGLYFAYYTQLVDLIGATSNEISGAETRFAAWLWRTYFRTL